MMGSRDRSPSSQHVVPRTRDVLLTRILADLTVPVVRAAVARQRSTATRFGYTAFAATAGRPKSNSTVVTQMRCMITASLRATATVARFMPRRLATETPQARKRDPYGYGSSAQMRPHKGGAAAFDHRTC